MGCFGELGHALARGLFAGEQGRVCVCEGCSDLEASLCQVDIQSIFERFMYSGYVVNERVSAYKLGLNWIA